MREAHEGPSESCCGYLPTPLAVTTHLRRLRLGDSVALGAERMARAERRRRREHPLRAQRAPALLDTKKKGDRPLSTLPARVCRTPCSPNTTAHHGEARVACLCNADPSRDQHPPSDFAAKSRAPGGERFRAQALRARECSPQGGRPHVHRDRSRVSRAADPMSTATISAIESDGRRSATRPEAGARAQASRAKVKAARAAIRRGRRGVLHAAVDLHVPSQRTAPHLRHHLASRRGQDHAHREAAALRRSGAPGGRGQVAQGAARGHQRLDGDRAQARHLGHLERAAVQAQRRSTTTCSTRRVTRTSARTPTAR